LDGPHLQAKFHLILKPRYTLPVSTGRVHGSRLRPMSVINDTRVYGPSWYTGDQHSPREHGCHFCHPCSRAVSTPRPVNTGAIFNARVHRPCPLYGRRPVNTGVILDIRVHGPWTRVPSLSQCENNLFNIVMFCLQSTSHESTTTGAGIFPCMLHIRSALFHYFHLCGCDNGNLSILLAFLVKFFANLDHDRMRN